MYKFDITSRTIRQGLALAAIIASSLATASGAIAGECPAGKMQPNARPMVDHKPVGVTDVTLGSINLEKQPANIRERELRFRKLTIEPGGIVPWHSHDDRPALIFVQQGEIDEGCRVACQALTRARNTRSARCEQRIVVLRSEVFGAATSAVQRLDEQLRLV